MHPLDVFIKGENINLCIPTEEFALDSSWYSWFNKQQNMRYLPGRGLFPNTREDQLAFFKNEHNSRLVLIIQYKEDYVGVISLSHFGENGSAGMAMVIDQTKYKFRIPYIALEAASFVTIHAFEVLGINKIISGQHVDLAGWNQRKEVMGYRFEGVARQDFKRGQEIDDCMLSSIIYDDYKRLKEDRAGKYWDSLDQIKDRIKKLPEKKSLDLYREFVEEKLNPYYEDIFKL